MKVEGTFKLHDVLARQPKSSGIRKTWQVCTTDTPDPSAYRTVAIAMVAAGASKTTFRCGCDGIYLLVWCCQQMICPFNGSALRCARPACAGYPFLCMQRRSPGNLKVTWRCGHLLHLLYGTVMCESECAPLRATGGSY